MKKFYVFIVACLASVTVLHAQNRFWVGPSNGNWNDVNNWSATSGGAGGQSVPNGAGFNVTFDQNALVNVDLDAISLNTLTVTNSVTAQLVVTASVSGTPTMTLLSTSLVTPGLRIDAGSRLEDSVATNGITFTTTFGSGAKGLVNGTWYFAGHSSVTSGFGATISVPAVSGLGNRLDVNGTIQFRNNTLTPSFACTYRSGICLL